MSDKSIPGAVFLIIGAGMVLMSAFIDVNKLSFFIFVGAVFVVIGFFKILLKLKKEAPRAHHHPANPNAAQGQHHPAQQHTQHPQHAAAHHAAHPQHAQHQQHAQHEVHHNPVIRCASCGVKLHPLFQFCPNCGQKLK
jgi:ABC-type nickel/cobalt efflux system permease component RcnA